MAALIAAMLPLAAFAQASAYKAGMEQYEALDFENARANLEKAIQSEGLNAAEIVQAREALVVIELSFGRQDAADRHAREILKLDPQYEPPKGASPAVQSTVRRAAKALASQAKAEQWIKKGKAERTAGIVLFSVLNAAGIPLIVLSTQYADDDSAGDGYRAGGASCFIVAEAVGIPLWAVGQGLVNKGRKALAVSWLEEHDATVRAAYDPRTGMKGLTLAFRW